MLLFVSHDGGLNGAPIVLFHFLKWLRANTRHDFNVLIRTDGPMVERFSQLADVHVLENRVSARVGRVLKVLERLHPNFSAQPLLRLPAGWNRRRWELVYSNTVTNGALVDSLRDRAGSVMTHVHEMRYWIERSGKDNWRRVREHSSRFIAVSDAVKSTLVDEYAVPSGLVDVVHAFVPRISVSDRQGALAIRKELGIPDSAFVVGGSGQESWRKGRDLFVQLAAIVRRQVPQRDIHFVWVGSTANRETQRELDHDIALAGVQDRMHWTGEVRDTARYFQTFDTFAMVSREDSFPLVCLEAGLLEMPILCFARAGGMPEFVEEDVGFVVPYLDLQTMADRIRDLADNSALCRALGARAREKVIERYTVNQAGPRILRLIEEQVLRSKRN